MLFICRQEILIVVYNDERLAGKFTQALENTLGTADDKANDSRSEKRSGNGWKFWKRFMGPRKQNRARSPEGVQFID